MLAIEKSGVIDFKNTAGLTTTSATAGAGTALPATPEGYLYVKVGGMSKKIPYFNI